MPRVFLPQILWHSKDNKRCDRVYSLDFQPRLENVQDNPLVKRSVTRLRLATGGADEFVHIWQISIHNQVPQYTHFVNQSLKKEEFEQPLSIKILARLTGHIGEVNAVRWSHDGKRLATGGEDRCIFLWAKDTQNGNAQGEYEENWTRTHYFRLSNVVNSISWCQENRIIAVSTEDGHISLVDTHIEGAGKIRYFDGHTNIAQGVALDPKNELLASLGSDQCLRIWKRRNQKSWKSILVLKGARDKGSDSSYSTASPENTAEIRRYGRYVFMSEELKTFFRRLDWSPDGRILVTPTGIRNVSKEAQMARDVPPKDGHYGQSEGAQNGPPGDGDAHREENGNLPKESHSPGDGIHGSMANHPAYTLYMFYRKLINFGIPMITHQSPTGPFVVVRFCPIYLSTMDKQKNNFLNKLMQGRMDGMKGKVSGKTKPVVKRPKVEKATPMTNKIDSYFGMANAPKEDVMANDDHNDEHTMDQNEHHNGHSMDVHKDPFIHATNGSETPVASGPAKAEDVKVESDAACRVKVECGHEPSEYLASTPCACHHTAQNCDHNGDHNDHPMDLHNVHTSPFRSSVQSHLEDLTTIDSSSPVKVMEHEDTTSLPEMIKMESIDDGSDGTEDDESDQMRSMENDHPSDPSEDGETTVMRQHENEPDEQSEPVSPRDSIMTIQSHEWRPECVSMNGMCMEGGMDAPNGAHTEHSVDHGSVDTPDRETTNGSGESPGAPENLEDTSSLNAHSGSPDGRQEASSDRPYNLRKRTSVVKPILFDNSVKREPRRRVPKKAPKPTSPKQDDYDTDLEEEVTIPRFIFATGTVDGSVCFYDTSENGGPIAVLKNLHFCPITDISWSPDGYVCASSSSDGYITFVIFNKRELT